MKVATHRLTKTNWQGKPDEYQCEFCECEASYWTQLEDGEKGLSRCVWHCQAHCNNARELAVKIRRW